MVFKEALAALWMLYLAHKVVKGIYDEEFEKGYWVKEPGGLRLGVVIANPGRFIRFLLR